MLESMTDQPTTPGWYWVRPFDDSPYHITKVFDIRGQLYARDPHLDVAHPIPITAHFWAECEWIGPITPADALELARLRANMGGHQPDA